MPTFLHRETLGLLIPPQPRFCSLGNDVGASVKDPPYTIVTCAGSGMNDLVWEALPPRASTVHVDIGGVPNGDASVNTIDAHCCTLAFCPQRNGRTLTHSSTQPSKPPWSLKYVSSRDVAVRCRRVLDYTHSSATSFEGGPVLDSVRSVVWVASVV